MASVRIVGRSGWRASANDMLELLGLNRNGKLPKDGMAEREIQGVRVYVRPYAKAGHGRHTCTHRVMAICTCGQHVPTGRLHQHKCKTQEVVNA